MAGKKPIEPQVDRDSFLVACALCDHKPKLADKVETAWLRGKTERQIAKHYNLQLDVVEAHVQRCLYNKYRSRQQRAAAAYDKIWDALNVAHAHYIAAPSMFTAQSYQGFLAQLRGLLTDLERVRDSEQLTDDIIQSAINPLIRKLTDSIILESGALKDDISAKMGETETSKLIKAFVRRVSAAFGAAAQDVKASIQSVLGEAEAKQKKQPVRRDEPVPLRIVKGEKP